MNGYDADVATVNSRRVRSKMAEQEEKRARVRAIVRQEPCASCGDPRWRPDGAAVCVGCRLPGRAS